MTNVKYCCHPQTLKEAHPHAHGVKKMAESQGDTNWKVRTCIMQVYCQVRHIVSGSQISITTSKCPTAGFMDALQSFVTTMEPEADFIVKLEKQTGNTGAKTTHKTSCIIIIICIIFQRTIKKHQKDIEDQPVTQ